VGAKPAAGEVGVLKYVLANDRVSNQCYLVIEFEHEHYVGRLTFDTLSTCAQISNLLRSHVGRRIDQIGELDI